MLDRRAMEERHLQLADAHIVRARELTSRLQHLIEHARRHDGDVEEAMRNLAAMVDAMATFVAHRDMIIRTLADIDAGRM